MLYNDISMEKNQKLALARKKLRKFQSKLETTNPSTSVVNGGMNSLPDHFSRNVRKRSGDGQSQTSLSHIPDFVNGHGAQVHSQTIDILVAEKSKLVQQLAQTRAQLEISNKRCLHCDGLLQELQGKMEKEQRENSRLAHELSLKTEMLARSKAQYSEQQLVMSNTSSSQEDLKEENAQLVSRTSSQAQELASLQQQMEKLRSQLAMQELLTQQLQASPPSTPSQASQGHTLRREMEELQGDVHKLNGCLQAVTRERDQALSDLGALREALLSQQQQSARKLGDYQTNLAEANLRIATLTEKLTALEKKQEVSTHAHFKEAESSQLMQQSLREENSHLLGQVKQLLADNKHINSLNCQLEVDLTSVQQDLSRVQGELAEQHRLLATIAQDKETISRAVSQNKDLKEQLTELQEAFVRQSHQNMELATELETERHHRLQATRGQQQTDSTDENLQKNLSISQEQSAKCNNEDKETSRLEDLTHECSSLQKEKEELLAELARLQTPASTSFGIVDQVEDGNLLQQSFTVLQERFIAVMADKAALQEQLQQYEHTIMQLSGETETIGEYVTLYQTQRAALRQKFREKDLYIQQLLEHKTSLEAKLREVQSLTQQLRASTYATPPNLPAHLRPTHSSSNLAEVERIMHMLERELVTVPESPGHCPCCSGQLLLV